MHIQNCGGKKSISIVDVPSHMFPQSSPILAIPIMTSYFH
jgi:hypothetical protein